MIPLFIKSVTMTTRKKQRNPQIWTIWSPVHDLFIVGGAYGSLFLGSSSDHWSSARNIITIPFYQEELDHTSKTCLCVITPN
jgi:hypothetical protein